MSRVRVVLADDHPVVLAGLGMLIGAEADVEIVGEASSGHDALQTIRQEIPDIAIIDISLPQPDGISVARELAQECPSVGVIMLTQHDDAAHFSQALSAGVRGYVLKKSAAHCLVSAIRGVLVGGLYVDPAMASHMFSLRGKSARPANAAAALTAREIEVLKLVAIGLTGREIAERLDVSQSSVDTYRARAAEKLKLETRAEIVRYASIQGWLAGA